MTVRLVWLFHDPPGRLLRQEDGAVDVEGLTRWTRHDLVEKSISGWLRTRVGGLLVACSLMLLNRRLGGKRRSAVHAA